VSRGLEFGIHGLGFGLGRGMHTGDRLGLDDGPDALAGGPHALGLLPAGTSLSSVGGSR
jgi:hypothetical protein